MIKIIKLQGQNPKWNIFSMILISFSKHILSDKNVMFSAKKYGVAGNGAYQFH